MVFPVVQVTYRQLQQLLRPEQRSELLEIIVSRHRRLTERSGVPLVWLQGTSYDDKQEIVADEARLKPELLEIPLTQVI